MIAKLKGLLDSVGEDWVVVDVGGVGYLAFASGRTLTALPPAGEAVMLFIETHVAEDHIHLYGFVTTREREMFRLLTSVQSVGNRVALAILSALDPDQLANAIAAQDKAAITRAKGVGPKLAQRIVTELKDRVAGVAFAPSAAEALSGAAAAAGAAGAAPGMADAVSALVNLGYGRAEAFSAVAAAANKTGETKDVSSLIKAGLKELSA